MSVIINVEKKNGSIQRIRKREFQKRIKQLLGCLNDTFSETYRYGYSDICIILLLDFTIDMYRRDIRQTVIIGIMRH